MKLITFIEYIIIIIAALLISYEMNSILIFIGISLLSILFVKIQKEMISKIENNVNDIKKAVAPAYLKHLQKEEKKEIDKLIQDANLEKKR